MAARRAVSAWACLRENPIALAAQQARRSYHPQQLHELKRQNIGRGAVNGDGPRTDADFAAIAAIIREHLEARVVILQEINGVSKQRKSVELDRLVPLIGPEWKYEIGLSGGAQRVAILWDGERVRKDRCVEFEIGREMVQGRDIFARDPLVCAFTFRDGSGQHMNDLVVVGLHLASGQDRVTNHNRAMEVLRQVLAAARADGTLSETERDLLMGGDFNANLYDQMEDFWEDWDPGHFNARVLAPTLSDDYPGTRLARVPLEPHSKIDYFMGSAGAMGISDELVQLTGEVHTDLLLDGFDVFRKHLSDHIPVSVRVRVVADDD